MSPDCAPRRPETKTCHLLGDHTVSIEDGNRLAATDPQILKEWFGKIGLMLSVFARGEDQTPVSEVGLEAPIKSIGNSTTTPRDLVNNEDVKPVFYLLSESVASRLKENGFIGQVVEVYVRDSDFRQISRDG